MDRGILRISGVHLDSIKPLPLKNKNHPIVWRNLWQKRSKYVGIFARELFELEYKITYEEYSDLVHEIASISPANIAEYDLDVNDIEEIKNQYRTHAFEFNEIDNSYCEIENCTLKFHESCKNMSSLYDESWNCVIPPLFKKDILEFNQYIDDTKSFIKRIYEFDWKIKLLKEDLIERFDDILQEISDEEDSDEEDSDEEKFKIAPTLYCGYDDIEIDIETGQLYHRNTKTFECCICWTTDIKKENMGRLQCNHSFCIECLHSVFKTDRSEDTHYKCCLCRSPIKNIEVSHLMPKDIKSNLFRYCILSNRI